ncbi:hypothetical protein Kpol_1031p75 [Vanderwaltozyma polyspora DSM 70294]|uniref:isoleucine--tRNA ligase n=1 Tax=Vanderwaltozyma polyspora (strain ATCC 22028 / DSM 70294 / BCRC 21397 / CBS 2163 / NBRC 10782 / NRRL Y-8283 / UCD 57-17) TaxID=436907 RepID=A7TI05_VANPO|nr:uncharacterized protein Kpol_1031p75 [Vanderwaltozyma polyspora DSM 70294]EDO18167.1 hypothetical protein Kpol_1031p75 [Vanderwaltozyma polyspora DSM 70294]
MNHGITSMGRSNCLILLQRRFAGSQHSFQKTLLLPKTKFSNRSNLQKTYDILTPQCSDQLYAQQWDEFMGKLTKIQDPKVKLKFVEENLFVIQDGPPYANGDLHFGHALNKILKDVLNRYNLIKGKYVYFRTGWDCHGLPIEMKALKEIDPNKLETISPLKIRSIAASHAKKAVASQLKQFKDFAIMTNWNDHYETVQPKYEIDQLKVFHQMYKRGYIRRQNKPVFWGTETRTALAESELEYNEKHVSRAAYVRFPLTENSKNQFVSKIKQHSNELPSHIDNIENIYCLIWTSTPWTLFSNRAISYNKNFNYVLISHTENSNDLTIVEKTLFNQVESLKGYQVICEIPGVFLEDIKYHNPLIADEISRPLLHGDHVTNSTGTGLVHTAPGHGADDYMLGVKNELEIYSPVNNRGEYDLKQIPNHLHSLLTVPESKKSRNVLDKNTTDVILELLSKCGMLVNHHSYTHSYPYDWRSKKPIIIRATPQWFADLSDVKTNALNSLESVEFFPRRGKNRLSAFIRGRNEWCISRQRYWGVPIPAFYRKDDPEHALISDEIIEHAINTISRKGINSWFSPSEEDGSDMVEWLPPSMSDVANQYIRGKDTMDVWFDSGSAWKDMERFYKEVLNLAKTPQLLSDIYLEGSDQHRGWFQSSLLTKVADSHQSIAPFKTLITHGFTLDENGIKMSKSIGNTISPKAIIEGNDKLNLPALGTDGLRYLVCQTDFTNDIVAGPLVMTHVAEALKKFRLTFRYLLGNLQTGNFKVMPFNELRRLDQYIISSLNELLQNSDKNFKDYNFSKVLSGIQYHMNNHLSAFYFDISKDSLYSDHIDSLKRRQIQSTLFYIMDSYRSILAPITPILVQDAWNYLPKEWYSDEVDNTISPMKREWPKFTKDDQLKTSFEIFEMAIFKEFQSLFQEMSSTVTKSEQTSVLINAVGTEFPFSEDELCDILKTSSVKIINDKTSIIENNHNSKIIKLQSGDEVIMSIIPSPLHKCPRCWKSTSEEQDKLCNRCEETIHVNTTNL